MPKTTRKRDYKAEYQRRIERGLAKGLSLSQARGHPKATEKPVRDPIPIPDKQLQISLKQLRAGGSLADAAKEIHVSPERLRNQAKALGAIRKFRGRWTVKKSLPRLALIYSEGNELRITPANDRELTKLGKFMNAVKALLNTNDLEVLRPFKGRFVKDRNGKKYPLETDPNALYRLSLTGSETFEQVYRIVV